MNRKPQPITIPQESWKHLFTMFDVLQKASDSKAIEVKSGKVLLKEKNSIKFEFDWKKLNDTFLNHLEKRSQVPLVYDVEYFNDFIQAINAAYYIITEKEVDGRKSNEEEFVIWYEHHFKSN